MTILGSKKIVTFNPDVSIDENQRFPICHHGTQSNALFLVPSAEKGILNAKRIGRILRIHNGQGAILIHVTHKTRTLIPGLETTICAFSWMMPIVVTVKSKGVTVGEPESTTAHQAS